MDITLEKLNEVLDALEKGELRVAEKKDGVWTVNKWVKEVILAGFRLGAIQDMSQGQFSFFDKDTFPVRHFSQADGVRIVPGGSSIRRGAYLAPGSIVMPTAIRKIHARGDAQRRMSLFSKLFTQILLFIPHHDILQRCASLQKRFHRLRGNHFPGGEISHVVRAGFQIRCYMCRK